MPQKTLEGYISKLREHELITYVGDSAKTGGYFITDKLKKIIERKSAD
jgi:ATP-dependent DNA helicase RecG